MNPDRQQAIDYLRAPAQAPWSWAEDGKVLVWRDGTTIAFREEIEQIIEWLAPNGLPAFGAIALLLAAGRGKIPQVADIVVESRTPLPARIGQAAPVLLSARRQLRAQLEAALAQLAKVSQLPAELNTGLKARCVLAEAVFEPARAERHVDARTVLRGMREPVTDADLIDTEAPSPTGNYIRQIHIVAEGLKPHTIESLTLRLQTGLDALPKPPDLALPTAERARRLIEELSRDRDCGAVARAARELMAAVRLPRRLGRPEQLAIGGVADITNRGPLDRLLLSELAYDDLTLASRVALNEALYLRREPPRREPPGKLAMVLDSGVRLWGIPRVLATAVALALIARDKQHHELLTWRAHGKQLLPVDLLLRTGLIAHLAALETDVHPGECLRALAEVTTPGAEHQSVLVTHHDTLHDKEFRRALVDHPGAVRFIATVTRTGRFELHALPLAHRPPLCEADLDLKAVFAEPSTAKTLKAVRELPAILGVRPFPLLLPLTSKLDLWRRTADGFTYATLSQQQLVRFRNQSAGAQILASDLPSGRTLWINCVDETVHVVKCPASQRPARLISLALPDGPVQIVDLAAGEEILAVHQHGDVILLIGAVNIRAHALSDGRLLHQIPSAHRWINGRFFRAASQFYFAAWDGAHVKLEPVTLPSDIPFAEVPAIFDRPGKEGPWLLRKAGQAVSLSSGERLPLPGSPEFGLNFGLMRISQDGDQLLVPRLTRTRDPAKPEAWVYGLGNPPTFDLAELPCHFFDRSPALPVWNVFRAVESLAKIEGELVICGRRGRWRRLTLNNEGRLKLAAVPLPNAAREHPISFTGQRRPAAHVCLLESVEWPSGSKAFLDSRGLLHLKSHDPELPEISLVLAEPEAVGWTSDGYVCGPPFFFEYPRASQPERVFERLRQFLAQL